MKKDTVSVKPLTAADHNLDLCLQIIEEMREDFKEIEEQLVIISDRLTAIEQIHQHQQ